jgi:hypothetical protein
VALLVLTVRRWTTYSLTASEHLVSSLLLLDHPELDWDHTPILLSLNIRTRESTLAIPCPATVRRRYKLLNRLASLLNQFERCCDIDGEPGMTDFLAASGSGISGVTQKHIDDRVEALGLALHSAAAAHFGVQRSIPPGAVKPWVDNEVSADFHLKNLAQNLLRSCGSAHCSPDVVAEVKAVLAQGKDSSAPRSAPSAKQLIVQLSVSLNKLRVCLNCSGVVGRFGLVSSPNTRFRQLLSLSLRMGLWLRTLFVSWLSGNKMLSICLVITSSAPLTARLSSFDDASALKVLSEL